MLGEDSASYNLLIVHTYTSIAKPPLPRPPTIGSIEAPWDQMGCEVVFDESPKGAAVSSQGREPLDIAGCEEATPPSPEGAALKP